jgi:hypothetical protein
MCIRFIEYQEVLTLENPQWRTTWDHGLGHRVHVMVRVGVVGSATNSHSLLAGSAHRNALETVVL